MTYTITGSNLITNGSASLIFSGSQSQADGSGIRVYSVLNGRDGTNISSYNVTSTSRTSTGRYVVNFSSTMGASTPVVVAKCKIDTGDYDGNAWSTGIYRITNNPSTTSVTIGTYYPGTGNLDCDQVHVVVFSPT